MAGRITKRLVEEVLDTTYVDLPQEAIRLSKRHFLDWTGACLAAVGEVPGQIVADYIGEFASLRGVHVLGYGLITHPEHAAFANGVLSHVMSLDDSGPSHPSVTVLPSLFAIGELSRSNGTELLVAQVLGYETFQKLNLVTKDAWDIRDRGWHPTGFFGAVAAALVSAKLQGLTLVQSMNAVGIAASMGGGLSQNIGNMTMALHAGNASRSGIVAARLAKEGFTGDQEILEGQYGLMNALAGSGNYDIEDLTKNFGNPYSVIDPGINVKPYPNCWGHHRVYDAVLHLVTEHDLHPMDIERIYCDLQPTKSTYRYICPMTVFEARYSLPFGIAVCVMDREMTLKQYTDARIADRETRLLMEKVKHTPQALDADKHKVTIEMRDGTCHSYAVAYSRGNAKNAPLTNQEIEDKYRQAAEKILAPHQVDRSIELVSGLEELESLDELIDSLVMR